MDFLYEVKNSEEVIIDHHIEMHKSEKLKDPITISISITMEKSKYYQRLKKYKTHIGEKILRLFD